MNIKLKTEGVSFLLSVVYDPSEDADKYWTSLLSSSPLLTAYGLCWVTST
jgi:hypothetical protein